MRYKRLYIFPRQLAGQHHGIPVFFIQMIPFHDRFIFTAQYGRQVRVAFQADPYRVGFFSYKREHLIIYLIDCYIFSERIFQLGVRHGQDKFLYLFMLHIRSEIGRRQSGKILPVQKPAREVRYYLIFP